MADLMRATVEAELVAEYQDFVPDTTSFRKMRYNMIRQICPTISH
jgi:hypothetical protein